MVAESENHEADIDPVQELFIKYLGGMETGEERVMGMNEFEEIMHAIHSPLNTAEDNSGTITDMKSGVTYSYKRTGDESDVTVTRVG